MLGIPVRSFLQHCASIGDLSDRIATFSEIDIAGVVLVPCNGQVIQDKGALGAVGFTETSDILPTCKVLGSPCQEREPFLEGTIKPRRIYDAAFLGNGHDLDVGCPEICDTFYRGLGAFRGLLGSTADHADIDVCSQCRHSLDSPFYPSQDVLATPGEAVCFCRIYRIQGDRELRDTGFDQCLIGWNRGIAIGGDCNSDAKSMCKGDKFG